MKVENRQMSIIEVLWHYVSECRNKVIVAVDSFCGRWIRMEKRLEEIDFGKESFFRESECPVGVTDPRYSKMCRL